MYTDSFPNIDYLRFVNKIKFDTLVFVQMYIITVLENTYAMPLEPFTYYVLSISFNIMW